jgi:hypothetical protein
MPTISGARIGYGDLSEGPLALQEHAHVILWLLRRRRAKTGIAIAYLSPILTSAFLAIDSVTLNK